MGAVFIGAVLPWLAHFIFGDDDDDDDINNICLVNYVQDGVKFIILTNPFNSGDWCHYDSCFIEDEARNKVIYLPTVPISINSRAEIGTGLSGS